MSQTWEWWDAVFGEFATGCALRDADALAGRGVRGVCDFDCGAGRWGELHDF